MKKDLFVRIAICLFSLCLFAFLSIKNENEITELRLEIPQLAKEVKLLKEESTLLLFEKEQFERPENLLRIAALPEYADFEFPIALNVLAMPKGIFIASYDKTSHNHAPRKSGVKLALFPPLSHR